MGETRGDFVAITKGLKAGETIVSTGVFKLRNGMAVAITTISRPKPELNPKPADQLSMFQMKSFTDLFIRRPVLALVVSLVILIAGLQAIKSLNVRQYPRSDIASVTVTTVYVGANAELVRGFITTPLERAIAAADGIDYLQSQSAQGVSTITARLKLNYDANKALSDISSKVNAIRRDLPPEAEIPVINIESADSQFASAYLSFTSNILQPNEITDYLIAARPAAPDRARRRAAGGHSRRTHLCHAHLAQTGTDGGAQRQPGAGPQGACAKQLSLARSAAPKARSFRSI